VVDDKDKTLFQLLTDGGFGWTTVAKVSFFDLSLSLALCNSLPLAFSQYKMILPLLNRY